MVEFWVCQVCKSLNRPNAGRCYHCRAKKGARPPEPQILKRNAPPMPGPAASPPPSGAGASRAAAASVAAPAIVATPVSAPIPAATPRSTGAPAGGYFSERAAPAPVEKRRRLPAVRLGRPGFLHLPGRFVPGSYVSAWRFGYVTTVAVGATLLVGLLLAAIAASPFVEAVCDRSIDPLASAFRPGGSAYPLSLVFVVVGTVALIMFSAFVGITTKNAPLLGSEAAPLSPARAARVWLNVLWAQARLAVLLVAPPILFGMGLGIPACIGLLVLIEWMQRHLTSLTDWLTEPGRHLVEVYDKLGLKGVGSLLIRSWRAAFVAANLLLMALWCVPIAVAVTHQISLFRREVTPPPPGLIAPQIALLALAAAFVVAFALTIGLLVPVTAEMSERQRVRRTLVIAGLARPWTNSPAGPASTAPREPDWDERPVTRWSDLDAAERDAWQRSLDTAGSFGTGSPRE